MRKAKITSDVAVMELPQSSLGVRTRAKTLALQRLQATNPPPNPPANDSSYLQLRSRRLEKPNDSIKPPKSGAKESCRENPEPNRCPINPNPKTGSRLRPTNTGSVWSDSVSFSKKEKGLFDERFLVATEGGGEAEDYADLGVEASFGENNFEFECREQSTRESTPCSLIRESDTIGTPPGSSTRPTSLTVSDRQIWNSMRDMPTTHEMEEFFTFAEQEQQRLFTEKYNFDVVNDLPIPGRYEWVRVCPP